MSGQNDAVQRPDGWIEVEKEPIFEVIEPDGRRYRIWANGRTEGFRDGAIIINGIAPALDYAAGLAKQTSNNCLLTVEKLTNLCS